MLEIRTAPTTVRVIVWLVASLGLTFFWWFFGIGKLPLSWLVAFGVLLYLGVPIICTLLISILVEPFISDRGRWLLVAASFVVLPLLALLLIGLVTMAGCHYGVIINRCSFP